MHHDVCACVCVACALAACVTLIEQLASMRKRDGYAHSHHRCVCGWADTPG